MKYLGSFILGFVAAYVLISKRPSHVMQEYHQYIEQRDSLQAALDSSYQMWVLRDSISEAKVTYWYERAAATDHRIRALLQQYGQRKTQNRPYDPEDINAHDAAHRLHRYISRGDALGPI